MYRNDPVDTCWPPVDSGGGRSNMQGQTERQKVKGLTTNLGRRSLRSPPRGLQTPLEETWWWGGGGGRA